MAVDRGLVAKVFVESESSWLLPVFVEQEGVDTALGAGGGQEFLQGLQEVIAVLGCGREGGDDDDSGVGAGDNSAFRCAGLGLGGFGFAAVDA